MVFGFAVFMLATNVKVPATPQDLAKSGKPLLIFAASFLVLCMLWYRHHRLMRRSFVPDVLGTLLVFFLLGTIALYSYPLQLYLRFPEDQLVFSAYAGGFALICLLTAAMTFYGAWKGRDAASAEERHQTVTSVGANLMLAATMIVFIFTPHKPILAVAPVVVWILWRRLVAAKVAAASS